MLIPPIAMIAGYLPETPDGGVILAVNEMDVPPLLAVTEMVLPETEPVTEEGLGGSVPSSYFWKRALISC